MPSTNPSETLTQLEFVTRTLPLYESSLAANCRFFVTVYDGPALGKGALQVFASDG